MMYWSIFAIFMLISIVQAQNLNVCSKELEKLQYPTQLRNNIFIGCQIPNGTYSNQTVIQLFDSLYCGSNEMDNDEIIENSTSVTVAVSAENRLFRWSRLCLILQNQSETFLLYSLTVDTAQSSGFNFFIERNYLPNLRLKRVPIFKTFPHINLRLPADFFYPFSCYSPNLMHSYLLILVLLALPQLY